MERETEKKMDFSPLDALFELLESPVMRSSKKFLVDDVAILKTILMDPPQQFVGDGSLKVLESLASKVGSIISSFDLKKMDQDMTFELEIQLFILLMPVRDWQYEAKLIYDARPKPSRFYYPTTGQLVFVDRLVENLEELMKFKSDLIGPLKHYISQFQQKLQFLSSRHMDIQQGKEEGHLMQKITNLAYEVEYAIDSFLVRDIPLWYCMLSLLNILNEFEQVEIETTDNSTADDNVVGFKAETESLRHQLIGESEKLCIISIVGMAGQGKTTLAKKLYSDPSVIHHFYIRAWCCVSQVYERRELLLELLGHIVQLSDTIHHKNYAELAGILHRSLLGQRFLIFLDDIWKTDALIDLARCFPNDNNGSRIMFTTRIRELASQSDSILQAVCPLTDDESWELLEKKLFKKESCPPELLDVGKQIAKKCYGLPLSVVLTAGILAKLEKKEDQWKQIAETLSSLILNAEAQGIIELSYKHLPDHLKPCFLYFGAFLEDREVPVRKLLRFWTAEGFIKHIDQNSLEDVAEHYLNDLIGRSLITVAQEKSNGGVKSCRVHDLLRDFCLTKATEENFLQLIRGYDKLFPSSNDHQDYGLDPNYSYSSTPTIYYLRRVCIYSKRNHFVMLKPSGPLVRSLLFFAASDMCPTYSYDISFISRNFRLLNILDLEDINIGDSLKVIDVLVRLRYLAVQGYFDFVPSSIANLKNLETFHVKGLRAKPVTVPGSILNMAKLRHLHIRDNASFDLDLEKLENASILDNLQTFSSPSLAHGDDTEKIVKRLRGIRKLKCTYLDSWDEAEKCNQFPVLKSLSQLVSLKVFYNGKRKYPCAFSFPLNLKKLTLSNFHMPWNEISQLAELSNLEILKLLSNAFDGEIWEMKNEVFPKLKFLKLDTLNVVEWSATRDHFPRLERLLLYKCEKLEEIPPGIGDIPTLERIEVMWCSPSVATSAREILDEYGEGLEVQIHPKVWDTESTS